MSSDLPQPKRKRPISLTSGSLLHPGSWRDKRARSTSRSVLPLDSGAATLGGNHSPNDAPSSPNPDVLTPVKSHEQLPSPNLSSHGRDNTSSAELITDSNTPFGVANSTPDQHTRRMSWTGLEQALQTLHLTTKICPPLHSAIDALKSTIHVFEAAAKAREDYDDLAAGLTSMVELLGKDLSNPASEEVMDTITRIAEKINREVEAIEQRWSRSGRHRLRETLVDEGDLIRRYRRIEQLFRQLQNTQLESLRPAKHAIFNSEYAVDVGRRACTEDTRVEILNDATTWADNPNGKPIFWVNGMAGTGKTTIAYSLCNRLEESRQLGASFFCTRTSPECRDAKRIIPTIAYQLARLSSPFRSALCTSLNNDPDIGIREPSEQFKHLFKQPLETARDSVASNLVVVVDALDECTDPGVVRRVLDMLFQFAATCPVKVFVTSRPDSAIRDSMMLWISEHNRPDSILYLHEINKWLVQEDIKLYLKDELKDMLPDHHNSIEGLAKQSGNLFIYASTAVRYIQPPGKSVDSERRLRQILAVGGDCKSKNGLLGIDKLYSAILSAAIDDEDLDVDERDNIWKVLSTVICTYEPVVIDTLAVLSGLHKVSLVVSALQPLRSVLHVSEHKDLVTTLHASFPDFMFSQERSKKFFCDKSSYDQILAGRCLDIMQTHLRFNICQIESSFIIDDKIPNLKERVEAQISQNLFYACRFWVDHLSQGAVSAPLVKIVHEFLSQRLLFWMEVLNLKGCMVIGAIASTKLHMWLRTSQPQASSKLVSLAHDAQTFVGNYAAYKVSESTPHLYLSALPLSSPTSLIYQTYQSRFRGLIQATGTLLKCIDQASIEVWSLSSFPCSACFLADRTRIVIGDKNGSITIQGAQAGRSTKAHMKAISSLAVSSCGTQVVTGSYDCTLCVWNVVDEKPELRHGPFHGHLKQVNSVGFSPDDKRLVSGSADGTIRVWVKDAFIDNHFDFQELVEHNGPVRSVVFSPDGTKIASGSADHTVCIWDGFSGVVLSRLQGHCQAVTAVQFSPCGTFIVSGSNDGTIRVWNIYDNTSPKVLRDRLSSSGITSVSVSPEGDRIASGSFDRMVRVWHKGGGEMLTKFNGHNDALRSVEFSTDGARILSTSDDKTIRIWNAQGRTDTDTTDTTAIRFNTTSPKIVDVSRDGAYIAVHPGNLSGSIEIWDTQSGKHFAHLPTSSAVKFLKFLSDNQRLFVGYKPEGIHIYNLSTTPPSGAPCSFSPDTRFGAPEFTIPSPDGMRVLSFSSTAVVKQQSASLDITTNGVRMKLQEPSTDAHFPKLAAFSLDSTRVVTATEIGAIWVWDTHDGKCIAGPLAVSQKERFTITAIDISSGGTRIVANSDNYALRIRNVSDGTVFAPFTGHDTPIRQVEFSADGEYVVSLDSCDNVIIWNASDGTIIKRHSLAVPVASESVHLLTSREVFFRLSPSNLCSFYWVSGYRDAIEYRWLCPTIQPQFRTELTPRSDGWLSDGDNLAVWVPPEIRPGFPESSGFTIRKNGTLRVDYDRTFCGNNWAECYVGGPVNGMLLRISA
ncbi:hypothetical protein FRC11_004073 [Ceratobasidium sp. 423]|nr:hypothetical protein FRC11_004073 [Ceratobasidium sp. 423]